jgi:hypothetical protein
VVLGLISNHRQRHVPADLVGLRALVAADQRGVHVTVWYAIAAIVFGAKPLSEKVSRFAFLLYIAFLQLASALTTCWWTRA